MPAAVREVAGHTRTQATTAVVPYEAPFVPPAPSGRFVRPVLIAPPEPDIPRPMRPAAVLSQAPYDAAMGRPRGLARLAVGTVLRAGAIGVGCYAVGLRNPKQIALGAVAASTTLSLLLLGYHATRTNRSW